MPDETNLSYDYTLTIDMSNELDISFKTNSYELEPSSYPYIDLLLNWLNERKQLSVEIRGHTDNVGSASSNLILSKNRAESVRKYLIEKGIDPKRITSKGFGETKPIESNDTEEGRQKNRRTELIIKHWFFNCSNFYLNNLKNHWVLNLNSTLLLRALPSLVELSATGFVSP